MRHKSQYNTMYKPRLRISLHWTWRGKIHYLELGSPGKKPEFPGAR